MKETVESLSIDTAERVWGARRRPMAVTDVDFRERTKALLIKMELPHDDAAIDHAMANAKAHAKLTESAPVARARVRVRGFSRS